MTEEQIKQNADAYANNYAVKSLYRPAYDGFIEGAHSRDKEIEELKYKIKSIEEDRRICITNLLKECDRLRNPWRDTSKELPPKFIDDIGEEYEQSIPVAVRTKNSNHWHMAEYYYDTKEWLCEENNTYIIRDEVTHWMPISELKKGE